MRKMGIVDCALSQPDPQTVPYWNLSEDELRKRIGPGEVGRAVPWTDLSRQQQDFQAAKMAIHAAMIDRMDREIGRVLAQLEAMGTLENTLIFFASDNGASAELIIRGDGHDPAAAPGSAKTFLCLGPGWSTAANTPLRLHKSWVHEGGHRLAADRPLAGAASAIAASCGTRPATSSTCCRRCWSLPAAASRARGTARLRRRCPAAAWWPRWPRTWTSPATTCIGTISTTVPCAWATGSWFPPGPSTRTARGSCMTCARDRCEMNDLARQYPGKVKELADAWQRLEDRFRRDAGQEKPSKPAERTTAQVEDRDD